MDVAVSGANGLIGSALRPALEAAGHRVVPLVRGDGNSGGPVIAWDPYQRRIDTGALSGVDAVVHLSGRRIRPGFWTRSHKREVLESRTRTTRFLAESLAGLDRPPAVLLSASAVGFYGERGDDEVTESERPGEGFFADLCAAWEAATAPAEQAGIRVVHMRSGLVLSADGGLLDAFSIGPFVSGRLGSGRQWMSWVSIDDEVQAFLHLLGSDLSGPVNLTGPNPVRNREFVTTLARVRGRRKLPPVPALAIKALFGRQPAREAALVSQRVLPARLMESGFSFAHQELEPALRAVLSRP